MTLEDITLFNIYVSSHDWQLVLESIHSLMQRAHVRTFAVQQLRTLQPGIRASEYTNT
ncbi:hypothetical protein WH47_01842 [Habropoda laboriosa]|uniref:Uncharacterized protein n=1 Tax=Habropoda laboriosa TaxID=597456 RepID=A0A0L7QTV2_9HYME|nr:hypothetical protein WH47_01842 [Habropoda laboriosa]